MYKFYYNKLVRDNAVAVSESEGAIVEYTVLDKVSHIKSLKDKLVEEALEVQDAPDLEELKKEIGDVEDVLKALKELCNISNSDIDKAQEKKRNKMGSFMQGYYIHWVIVEQGSRIYKLCKAAPHKYQEEIV